MGRVTHNHSCGKVHSEPTCHQCEYKRAAIVTCKEVGLDFDLGCLDLPPAPEDQRFEEESGQGDQMNDIGSVNRVVVDRNRKLRWLDQQQSSQTSDPPSNCSSKANTCSPSDPTYNTISANSGATIGQSIPDIFTGTVVPANEAGLACGQVSCGLVPETGVEGVARAGEEEQAVGTPEGLPVGQHHTACTRLQTSTIPQQTLDTSSTMSTSDVPLVVLTTCMSEDTTDTAIDDDIDDLRDIRDVNDVIFASARGLLGNSDLVISVDATPDMSSSPLNPNHHEPPLSAPPTITTAPAAITLGRRKQHQNVRRSASVRSEGPPSYHSIFASSDSKTRLSLPSARDAFRRLSDVWRQGSPRTSMTSVYPESPTSVTTLTGFIIRDKNAEGETQSRQVFRLAAVLLVCGIAILILETVTSFHTEAMVTGYPYAGIGAGIFIACTGILGILAATRKDCPHKYFSFYKGLSLISLLMGVVVLCGTLANLDVRWLSHTSQVANLAEIVLYITKVLLAGVDIAAALASIYI